METTSKSIAERVKGGVCPEVKLRGSEMYGKVVSVDERFDFKINKYFPIFFFTVDFGSNKMEFTKEELVWL